MLTVSMCFVTRLLKTTTEPRQLEQSTEQLQVHPLRPNRMQRNYLKYAQSGRAWAHTRHPMGPPRNNGIFHAIIQAELHRVSKAPRSMLPHAVTDINRANTHTHTTPHHTTHTTPHHTTPHHTTPHHTTPHHTTPHTHNDNNKTTTPPIAARPAIQSAQANVRLPPLLAPGHVLWQHIALRPWPMRYTSRT